MRLNRLRDQSPRPRRTIERRSRITPIEDASSQTRSDETLVEDYLDGDAGAFRVLIDRHHDPLMGFLYRMMGGWPAADDAFQETWVQVHHSLESFDTSRTFRPWLFTIAANKARDLLRKAGRRPAVSLHTPLQAGGDSGDLVDLIEGSSVSPTAAMDREDLSERVQRAVQSIPPRLREILLLAYFQKMPYAQMADALGIPVGTVKSRLHAAVAAFAKAWAALESEDGSDNVRESSGSA
ncbi:MAG: RNA polymerase sigma factor [Planctomycetota bacterium]